ncbi:hypothetical protein H6G89_22190 [Oscillatoria sp. FACHB-1407]|uniref:hypothetical protein n=1 Tax=Oscillatoria sp. FACHB-1407 TaxID=2692847 RepID=UPI001689A207|nr:hypothetical protein [Oscillatoria sp. FACHB-1407]MBD2463715.1 hypothetical protein [Oscillatoria sp. FACHB-1407]
MRAKSFRLLNSHSLTFELETTREFDRRPTKFDRRSTQLDGDSIKLDGDVSEFDRRPTKLNRDPIKLDSDVSEFDRRPTKFDRRPTKFDRHSTKFDGDRTKDRELNNLKNGNLMYGRGIRQRVLKQWQGLLTECHAPTPGITS